VKFLLFLLYYFERFFMAIIACSGIGLALAMLVAVANAFTRPNRAELRTASVRICPKSLARPRVLV
jgi:hypothetical protein